jgi:hypothetical protein
MKSFLILLTPFFIAPTAFAGIESCRVENLDGSATPVAYVGDSDDDFNGALTGEACEVAASGTAKEVLQCGSGEKSVIIIWDTQKNKAETLNGTKCNVFKGKKPGICDISPIFC